MNEDEIEMLERLLFLVDQANGILEEAKHRTGKEFRSSKFFVRELEYALNLRKQYLERLNLKK